MKITLDKDVPSMNQILSKDKNVVWGNDWNRDVVYGYMVGNSKEGSLSDQSAIFLINELFAQRCEMDDDEYYEAEQFLDVILANNLLYGFVNPVYKEWMKRP